MDWNYWSGVLYAAVGMFCVFELFYLSWRFYRVLTPLKAELRSGILIAPPVNVTLAFFLLFALFIANTVIGVFIRLAQPSFTFTFTVRSGALILAGLTYVLYKLIDGYEQHLRDANKEGT